MQAYRETGSVWRAGKRLGMVGQSVWERLRALNYQMAAMTWTSDEIDELKQLAGHATITDIANRLGRPYAGVACKISNLGLSNHYGNHQNKKVRRKSGYTKDLTIKWVKALRTNEMTARAFARAHGLDLEQLVQAFQRYDMEFWREYSRTHTDIQQATCPQCGTVYHPLTKKQKTCSRRCSGNLRRDADYFGGNRKNTIGLADGICQLCQQQKSKGLSAHHLIGKENDPENKYLIALCQGCHKVVSLLAGRIFIDTEEGWQTLIHVVMARRLGAAAIENAGLYVCVDIEKLNAEKLQQLEALEQPLLAAQEDLYGEAQVR